MPWPGCSNSLRALALEVYQLNESLTAEMKKVKRVDREAMRTVSALELAIVEKSLALARAVLEVHKEEIAHEEKSVS